MFGVDVKYELLGHSVRSLALPLEQRSTPYKTTSAQAPRLHRFALPLAPLCGSFPVQSSSFIVVNQRG